MRGGKRILTAKRVNINLLYFDKKKINFFLYFFEVNNTTRVGGRLLFAKRDKLVLVKGANTMHGYLREAVNMEKSQNFGHFRLGGSVIQKCP